MEGYGTLTLDRVEDTWSVWLTAEHDEVHVQHGTRRVLKAVADLDLEAVTQDWLMLPDHPPLLDHIRSLTYEPDEVDAQIGQCLTCKMIDWQDDMFPVGDHDCVCERCVAQYPICYECEIRYYRYDMILTQDTERWYCEGCDDYCHYCEDCDDYYSEPHDHGGNCNCDPPTLAVSLRNDGHERLVQDTLVNVALPSGVISNEGIDAIHHLIRTMKFGGAGDADLYHAWGAVLAKVDTLDPQWQTRQGNYTKRLSRMAYKYGVKTPPELLSEVGNIARAHSTAVAHDIEITRDLNLEAEEFCHEGSCWWGSYSESRCALKTNGGFALRSFDEDHDPVGRAWVLPLRVTDDGGLTPTFDTVNAGCYVTFNGYGYLEGYTAPRILAHMLGMTYRKIGLTLTPMYINGDVGYLVAPEEIAKDHTDSSISLSLEEHSDLYQQESTTEGASA